MMPLLTLTLLLGVEPYPKQDLLIEPVELSKIQDENLILLDARDEKAYQTAHIPRAILAPTIQWAKLVVDSQADWSDPLAKFGISPKSKVIVYALDIRDQARLWWILRQAGVESVKQINGGWTAWESAKLPTETTIRMGKPIKPVPFPKNGSGRLATKEDVLATLKDKKVQIVDGRSDDEYCGNAKSSARSGHIPGAIPLEWSEFLTEGKKYKSSSELQKLITSRKIDLNQAAITYCQAGGRAAVVAFGLELMGGQSVRNYYKSWSEWGNDKDTPIELPKK